MEFFRATFEKQNSAFHSKLSIDTKETSTSIHIFSKFSQISDKDRDILAVVTKVHFGYALGAV